jgi:hypothetical protein
MKRKKVNNILIIDNEIDINKVDESLSSLEKIEEISPTLNIRDYLRDIQYKNLNKNK